ncbi:hypothetical protein A7D00_3413 [Trichophyton violaceum]|uniref:F-box domain-containing protein n=1 Tax=Trichophyton violaceum TaxID=34388 RepID=A0A178FK59_TRIVO|nr:hypothetical protein A7D00_3413 [Trichophyton violaceum]
MDRLPDELLMHIIYQAIGGRGDRSRTNFACVARRWQAIAEAKNWRFFFLPSREIDRFAKMLARVPSRREALRKIYCLIDVCSEPTDGRQYVDFYDSSGGEESHPESTRFTRAIYTLFEALAGGDEDAQPPLNLKLKLQIASSGIYPITIERFLRIVPLDGHRKTLPTVRYIESLKITFRGRSLHPAAAATILAALPCLGALCMPLEPRGPQSFTAAHLRAPHLHAVSRHLETSNYTNLQELKISNSSLSPLAGINPALHKLSQSAPLVNLWLFGNWFLSPALFWPAGTPSSTDKPFWPKLQSLHIRASSRFPDTKSATGGFDFLEKDEAYRYAMGWDPPPVEPAAFDLLVSSMSKAVLQMPALRVLTVKIKRDHVRDPRLDTGACDYDICVECLDSGEESAVMRYREGREADKVNAQSYRRWRVWLLSPVDWSPSWKIRQLWQQFVGPDGITGTKTAEEMY